MAEPDLKQRDESESDGSDGDDVPTKDEAEVDMVQTDIESTGADPDGFFDGVETDTSGDVVDDSLFDGVDDGDSGSSDDGPKEAAGTRSSGLAQDINAGVARAAVIGLDESWETGSGEKKKSDLESEFRETFEAFRLGHYASICAEEYLLMEAEDIHPVWGLIGAALICGAVIVFKRPDGDQLVDSAKMSLGSVDLGSIKANVMEGSA